MPEFIRLSGPLFDGIADADLDRTVIAVQRAVADEAEQEWQANMTASFKNPSDPPKYQAHVNIVRRGSDLVVNDGYPGSRLLYGPWLEGVGSRNAATRFKGYFAMRRAAQTVAQKTTVVAKAIIDAFLARANGV